MKVNLGCGHIPIEGYVNVDKYAREADVHADALECTFEDVDEVVAYHFLEHVTRGEAAEVLRLARTWVKPGGKLHVEVPDSEVIFRHGPDWVAYVYGAQEHEGEFHRWGYTLKTLEELVRATGWEIDESKAFLSEHHQRTGMPCIEVRAHAA